MYLRKHHEFPPNQLVNNSRFSMKVSDFDYDLPEELIAKYPPTDRGNSRLLTLDGSNGVIRHQQFRDIVELLEPGDLLIFNDTKVVPARLFGIKETGGKIEILFERKLDDCCFLAHVKSSRSPVAGSLLKLESGREIEVQGRQENLFELRIKNGDEVFSVLESEGHIPLPPYIDRPDDSADVSRYQTVYAKRPGAAAAPTAGLHFDEGILAALNERGVKRAYVTLHVGAGTFQPVKVEDIRQHLMHSEWIDVPEPVVKEILETKRRGNRVVAVGTTSLRSLESAAQEGVLEAFRGDTDIFIYPGYRFHVVDALITNFHLPKSTLLMLVSAFAGKCHIDEAYHQAISQKYQFFSYGDAMFLLPEKPSTLEV